MEFALWLIAAYALIKAAVVGMPLSEACLQPLLGHVEREWIKVILVLAVVIPSMVVLGIIFVVQTDLNNLVRLLTKRDHPK